MPRNPGNTINGFQPQTTNDRIHHGRDVQVSTDLNRSEMDSDKEHQQEGQFLSGDADAGDDQAVSPAATTADTTNDDNHAKLKDQDHLRPQIESGPIAGDAHDQPCECGHLSCPICSPSTYHATHCGS